MKATYRSFLFLLWVMLCVALSLKGQNPDAKITLPKSKGTVYKLLGQISDRSGYLFIYDSHIVDNNKESRIKGGDYSIREAIREITGDATLEIRYIGNHILIHQPEKESHPPEITLALAASPREYLIVEGRIVDKYNNTPIPFATVGIPEAAIGTVTNLNGEFRFRFPDTLAQAPLQFTHIGYAPVEIESRVIAGTHQIIRLEPQVISLQEVIVRVVHPEKAIDDMLQARRLNYASDPVYHTAFYREGIERKKGLVNMTEAIFQIYKTPFSQPSQPDLVKLLKMRRIVNQDEKDTLITKFKSGIDACLMLDLVKNVPEFIHKEERMLYDYAHADIRIIDDRLANIITFAQKKGIKAPLFKGELYIDTESNALLGATFQIAPDYVSKSASLFVEKKSKNLTITPQEISYTVSYKEYNGFYYINHVRGDLTFRIRKKRSLFSRSVHTWFEMVVCKTETTGVQRFQRSDRLPTRSVFSDTHFEYDKEFWKNFNIILPEDNLNESISKISSVIEETEF